MNSKQLLFHSSFILAAFCIALILPLLSILFLMRLREMSYGCAPASGRGRRIRPGQDEGCAFKDGAHHLTLHATALAVNDAYAAKARAASLSQILFDDSFGVSRLDCVQVEYVCDFKPHRFRERVERIACICARVRRFFCASALGSPRTLAEHSFYQVAKWHRKFGDDRQAIDAQASGSPLPLS
jgi:hypothetical protein